MQYKTSIHIHVPITTIQVAKVPSPPVEMVIRIFLLITSGTQCGAHRASVHKMHVVWSLNAGLFVCVEVLRASQPNGVMSSAVSLPNHTFTGQA